MTKILFKDKNNNFYLDLSTEDLKLPFINLMYSNNSYCTFEPKHFPRSPSIEISIWRKRELWRNKGPFTIYYERV
jgi:hypothetical protein